MVIFLLLSPSLSSSFYHDVYCAATRWLLYKARMIIFILWLMYTDVVGQEEAFEEGGSHGLASVAYYSY